jgi:hypothetical protein
LSINSVTEFKTDQDIQDSLTTAKNQLNEANVSLQTLKQSSAAASAPITVADTYQPSDLQSNGRDVASTGYVELSSVALLVIDQLLLNEKNTELDKNLNGEGYQTGGSNNEAGEIPNLWIQILTNIDEDGNSPINFIKTLSRGGKNYNVLDNLKDPTTGATLPGILDASKSSIGWTETIDMDSGDKVNLAINSWIRLTPVSNPAPGYGNFVTGMEQHPGETVYVSLDDRSKVYARYGFLTKMKDIITKSMSNPQEEREVANVNGKNLTIPIDSTLGGGISIDIPVDKVELKNDATGDSIIYYAAPSQTDTVSTIQNEYNKVNGDKYPDLAARKQINDILGNFFSQSVGGKGLSPDGSDNGALDITSIEYNEENFKKKLADDKSRVGVLITKKANGMLKQEASSAKKTAMTNPSALTESLVLSAFFETIQTFLFAVGNHNGPIIHRIRKYKDYKQGVVQGDLEYAIQCNNAATGGYCLRYNKTTGNKFENLRDASKKLYLFDNVNDVKMFAATTTSSSVNTGQQLLDTDDESNGTFRFIPNI